MQHRNGHDEGEVEPVGDVDMRFLALENSAKEKDEIRDPDDRQPDVDIPFRLGIFAAFGDAQQIAGRGHDDEKLISPEHEPGEIAAKQPRAGRALHDIHGCAQKGIAAEGEDDAGGMKRPQPAEIEPGLDIEVRECKLKRDHYADQHADDAPEHRRNGAVADWSIHVSCRVDWNCRLEVGVAHQHRVEASHGEEQNPHVLAKWFIHPEAGGYEGAKSKKA
ncbi:hypothetical protein MPL3365_290087 [Mesorhizobium plurifarium]|uniref:Uncharacterized protein n=1 Tax=Mesorhizobium plurifarium TaxID=69974 RepID=A0A090GUY3_MESPL|nr:hypothetical protein MPL3365_290087 [Mesorhizobium plurifarium]